MKYFVYVGKHNIMIFPHMPFPLKVLKKQTLEKENERELSLTRKKRTARFKVEVLHNVMSQWKNRSIKFVLLLLLLQYHIANLCEGPVNYSEEKRIFLELHVSHQQSEIQPCMSFTTVKKCKCLVNDLR